MNYHPLGRNQITKQLARLAADLSDGNPGAVNPFPPKNDDGLAWQFYFDQRRAELSGCAPAEFERDRAPAPGWDANGSPVPVTIEDLPEPQRSELVRLLSAEPSAHHSMIGHFGIKS